MSYSLREALAAFRRAPLLVIISIISISLSLFVIGLFALTAYNVREALDRIEERVEVVAYLRDSVTAADRIRFESEVAGQPEVETVRYVSKTEALATAMREMPEFRDAFSGLDTNPLPASYEIRVREGYRTPEATDRLATLVQAYAFVEDAESGREWVAKIESLGQIAAGTTAMIGGAFAAVAGIVIATAVRIGVFARREEIEIMHLVGATDGFVQRPFLIEGLLSGLLGGLLAVLLTWVAFTVVDRTLLDVEWIPTEWLVLTVLVGALYGLLASGVSVRRHLSHFA